MKNIKIVLLLLFFFYYCFPQALNVAGSSFILFSGLAGVVLYFLHKMPFIETFKLLGSLALLIFVFFTCVTLNGADDGGYAFNYAKSNIAWIFSAYLAIFFLFSIHERPSFHTLLYYLVGAVALQCFFAVLMNFDEGIKDFLISIQLQTDIGQQAVDIVEEERLIGYGTGFFGAGAIAGFGLITLGYLFMKEKMSTVKFIILAVVYAFIFFVGLFMARTASIGFAASVLFMLFLYLTDKKADKKKLKVFIVSFTLLAIVGSSLMYTYFPTMAEWGFELFNNFFDKGEFSTKSSDGMLHMLFLPDDTFTFLFGKGSMSFFGSDIGFTRLAFYSGVIGMVMFFIFPMSIVKLSLTKDWGINAYMLVLVAYVIVLNIKGLIDQNPLLYPMFFFFMFYKYYVYMPKMYANAKQKALENKMAIQMLKSN